MYGKHGSEPIPKGVQAPPDRPWPPRALLAGEEEGSDEPHIHRGID